MFEHVELAFRRLGGAGRSGRGGCLEAGADAVLAASIFHRDKVSIQDVKNALEGAGAVVR